MNTPAILILTAAAAAAAVLPAQAATHIGVSVGINAPGQYGRVDIDNHPQPMLVNPRPIVIAPSPVAQVRRPIYLYVPAAHQSNWGRYCRTYRACGQPVYFVRENWVRDEYRREHEHRGRHDGRKAEHEHGDMGRDRHGH